MILLAKLLLLFIVCVILTDNSAVNGASLKCSFADDLLHNDIGKIYYCYASNHEIFDNSRVKIDATEGSHLSGRTNDDVKAVYMYSISMLKYIPGNMDKHFQNLIGIYIQMTNLEEIKSTDLAPFPKLKYLYLQSNKISTLDESVFQSNPELISIRLINNQITQIDPHTFDNLNNLNILTLSGNKCKTTFVDALTRSDVLNVISKINNGECLTDDVIQKKKKPQCNELTANNTILQTANEEWSTKYQKLKNENQAAKNELKELRVQYEKLQSKQIESEKIIKDSEKVIIERDEKIKVYEQSSSELNQKVVNLMEKLDDLRVKYVSILQSKLDESEKLVEKYEGRKSQFKAGQSQSEDGEKNDCMTIYFGPNQRPIVLAN